MHSCPHTGRLFVGWLIGRRQYLRDAMFQTRPHSKVAHLRKCQVDVVLLLFSEIAKCRRRRLVDSIFFCTRILLLCAFNLYLAFLLDTSRR